MERPKQKQPVDAKTCVIHILSVWLGHGMGTGRVPALSSQRSPGRCFRLGQFQQEKFVNRYLQHNLYLFEMSHVDNLLLNMCHETPTKVHRVDLLLTSTYKSPLVLGFFLSSSLLCTHVA